ncbi:MAG: hypothetical protein AAF442_03910 [Pseudomonadota bacterium]
MNVDIDHIMHITQALTAALNKETQSALVYDLEGMAAGREEKETLVQRFEEAIAAIDHHGHDVLTEKGENEALKPIKMAMATLQEKAQENEKVLNRLSTAQQDFIDMIIDVARARQTVIGTYGPQGTPVRTDIGVSLRHNQML